MVSAGGEHIPILIKKINLPDSLLPQGPDRQSATGERGHIIGDPDLRSNILLIRSKVRSHVLFTGKMGDLHPDNVLSGTAEDHLKHRAVQHIAPASYRLGGRQQVQLVSYLLSAYALGCIAYSEFRFCQPVSIGKFHKCCSPPLTSSLVFRRRIFCQYLLPDKRFATQTGQLPAHRFSFEKPCSLYHGTIPETISRWIKKCP